MVQYTLLSAVVPSLLLLWYFHAQDLHPEPQRVVWTTFFLGVLTVVPVLLVASPLTPFVKAIGNPWLRALGEAFVLAAIPEELFKLLVLLLYAVRRKEFDEPMDGIVYGVVASLGFATLENVIYVSKDSSLALLRALTAVPGHAFTGAIMGYYVGQAYFGRGHRTAFILRGYLVATILHGLYDFPLFVTQTLHGMNWFAVFALAILALEGRWALFLARRLRREQLAEERHTTLTMARTDAVLVGGGGIAQVSVAVVASSTSGPAPEPRRSFGTWVQLVLGGLLATGGGMMTLGLLVGLVTQRPHGPELTSALVGGLVIGLLPLLLGLFLFRHSLRRSPAALAPAY